MAKQDYATRGPEAAERLIADLFALGNIGYVALGARGEVLMREAPGLATQTTQESNFYEETIVNPTLLGLAMRRGEIDCGGVRYVAVGYGDFVQLVMPMKAGHVSIGLGRKASVPEIAAKVAALLERHGLAPDPQTPRLLV